MATREQSFMRPGTGVQSVSVLDPSKMNNWGRPADQGHLQLPAQLLPEGMPDSYGDFGSGSLVSDANMAPDGGGGFFSGLKEGGWTNAASAVADIGQVGLGIYSAMEQSKMNEFMKSYYGEEMARTRTDFGNVARSSNEALASRQQRVLSAQGDTTGTDVNREGVAAYMDEWGAQESF